MYIKQIMLKNIRGFADLQFDLTRPDGIYAGWTVFTGDNGSGKSTLLKAIATDYVDEMLERIRDIRSMGYADHSMVVS